MKPLPFQLEIQHRGQAKEIFASAGKALCCPALERSIDHFLDLCDIDREQYASKATWQEVFDALFFITRSVLRAAGPSVEVHRFDLDTSETAVTKQRPDVLLLHRGHVLLRGEERSWQDGRYKAALIEKMRCWNPLFYGEFPFIIGYETAGPYVDLFVIDKSDRSSVRVRRLGEFNLRIDRGKLVQVAFNLALLFSEMIRLSPLSPVPSIMPYGVDTNEKRVLVLLDDRIERAIRESDAVTHADLERIYDIYKTLERLSPQGSEMTHLQTVLRLTKSPYDVTVELGPVGWQRYPSDEDAEVWLRQMLTALKAWHECGYSHGDVQWRNIVYVPTGVGTGYWLLIDMDESRQPDTTFINWSHEFHGSKLCFQHDLFQLGNLLAEISPKLPSYLETMKTLLLSSVGRREVTAEKALAKLADLTKNSGG